MKSSRRSARREERRKLIKILAIVLPLLLLLGLVLWSFTRWQARQVAQRIPAGTIVFDPISEGIDLSNKERALRRILELYSLNISGGASLEGLNSFQVSGDFIVGEDKEEIPFVLTKKAPERIRIQVKTGGAVFLRGHNGRTTWTATSRNGIILNSQERTGAGAREIVRHADLTGHLHKPGEKGWTLKLEGLSEFDGVPFYEIHGVHVSGDRIHSFLDTETFAERRRISWIEEDGVVVEEESRLSDHIIVDRFSFPTRVETLRDGTWVQNQRISDIKVNIGVFDWIFEMPEVSTPQLENDN